MTFLGHAATQFSQWWSAPSATEMTWLAIGFLAQLMFSMRFIVQWIVSERAGKSVIPFAFWFFSMGGGLMTLAYGFVKREPVIIMGQGLSTIIYVRNIMLIMKERKQASDS